MVKKPTRTENIICASLVIFVLYIIIKVLWFVIFSIVLPITFGITDVFSVITGLYTLTGR